MKKYLTYIDSNVSLEYVFGKHYSIGRLLLSLSTFSTIAFNDVDRLFNISFVQNPNIRAFAIAKLSIFNIFYKDLFYAKLISCLILIVIMLGFLPSVTSILQWWLSFSIYASAYITEGGDQVNMVLSFLLIPLCLFDNRVNFWKPFYNNYKDPITAKVTIFLSLLLIQFQVSVLYFISGFSKIYTEQWREGTALYYWMGNTEIGFNKFLIPFFQIVFDNRYILFFSCWAVMLFEILLSFVWVTNLNRKLFFKLGLIFHFAIFLCFGLFSFSLSMSAALLFYFLSPNKKYLL